MLVDFPRKEMSKALDYVDNCNRIAVQINPGAISYEGYEVLRPHEAARHVMAPGKKGTIPTVFSELKMVRFLFTHHSQEGQRKKVTYLNLPYLHDDYLVIRGRELAVHKGISARIFTRDTEVEKTAKKKEKTKSFVDVLLVNPNRVKIQCKRHLTFTLRSACDGRIYPPIFLVTAKAHDKSSSANKRVESTLVLYLLAKYGLPALMDRFDIPRSAINFVPEPPHSDAEYDYFEARNNENRSGPMFYMKVSREELKRPIVKKVVAESLYLLSHFGFQNMDEVLEARGTIWKIMLGLITSSAPNPTKAHEEASKHLMSADFFLDPLSQQRYKKFGVDVADFYELIAYMFEHIDDLVVNTVPQNLYDRKIDVVDTLFITTFAEMIFRNFYHGRQQSQLKEQTVDRILKFPLYAIEKSYNKKPRGESRDSDVTIYAPTVYGTDWLSAVGAHKVRRGGSALQRFHPSMAYVESLTALSGKESGRTGYINPFLVIDFDTGAIIRAPWAQDIDTLGNFIPLM